MAARTVEIAFLGSTAQLEESLRRAGFVADESGNKIGDAFSKGASKAGGAISKLGQEAAGWGIPFAGSLETIGKHLDDTTGKTQKLHAALSEAGKVTLFAGTAGLAAAGVEAVKLGAAYESAQAKIQASTGASEKSVSSLTKAFGGTAGKFESSGQEMEAAYAGVAGQLKLTEGHVLSTGEAMRFQASATELANGTGEELTATTSALAGEMQAFHLSAGQAAGAADELYNVSKALDVPISQVESATAKLHSRLGELAPSFGDVGGLMVALAQHGVQGSRGLQVVNTAFQTLVGGSEKTDAVLKALGVSIFNQNGKFIGMQNVIAQLQPKLAGLTEQHRLLAEKTLFGTGAAQIMGQVVLGGVPAFEKATDAATKAGSAHAAAARQMDTLKGEAESMGAAIKTVGGDFGVILAPEVKLAGQALEESIQWLEKNQTAAYALGGTISLVLGAAVSVFAVDKAKKFIGSVKDMGSEIAKLSKAMMGATGTMTEAFGQQADAAETSAGRVEKAQQTTAGSVKTAAGDISTTTGEIDTSFASTATAASDAEAGIAASMGSEVATVSAADAKIEEDNTAAAGTFSGVAGKLGAGAAALGGAQALAFLGTAVTDAHPLTEVEREYAEKHRDQPTVFGHKNPYYYTAPTSNQAVNHRGTRPESETSTVEEEARRYGIDPKLLFGVWGNETSFGKNVTTSSTGAKGDFQFEPGTAKEYAYPMTNSPSSAQFAAQAAAAAKYLASLIQRFHGNTSEALEAYSGGTPGYAANAQKNGESFNAAVQKAMEAEGPISKSKKTTAALGIPVAVGAMLKTADELLGTKYTHGGGHGASANDPVEMLKKIGVDCSGFVSKVLASGGLPTAGLTTEGLAGSPALAKGKGQYVTVYDRADAGDQSHALIEVLGHYFESGGNPKYNPSGGVTKLTAAQAAGELAGGGFVAYHPAGLNSPVKGGISESKANRAGKFAETAYNEGLAALKTAGQTELSTLKEAMGSGSIKRLESVLGARTSKGAPASKPAADFDRLIAELHRQGMNKLVTELRSVHADALATERKDYQAAVAEQVKQASQIASAKGQAEVDAIKDAAATVTAEADQALSALRDAAQTAQDSFDAQAQAVKDSTQALTDSNEATVTQIKDQSQTEVDKLAERGLYGLNLVAQQQQVALDETKTGLDAQIAQAHAAIDNAQKNADDASGAVKAYVDSVTAEQDVLLGQAKTHLAQVEQTEHGAEDQAKEALARAQTGTALQIANAEAAVTGAEAKANRAITEAQNRLGAAESAAGQAEQAAQNKLNQATGSASLILSEAEKKLAETTGRAKIIEAEREAGIAKTKAEASTQYAGSGMTVNITGINPTDSAAVASEMGWLMRTQLPA